MSLYFAYFGLKDRVHFFCLVHDLSKVTIYEENVRIYDTVDFVKELSICPQLYESLLCPH